MKHCMLMWQVTLDVGFGRRLHIPQQQSSRQTPPADSDGIEQTLPAAFFTFEQVSGFCMALGQPAAPTMLSLAYYWNLDSSSQPHE